MGSQLPEQGWNPHPLHWMAEVLTAGPPGKFSEPFSCLVLAQFSDITCVTYSSLDF